ncbi:hypothetical protein ACTRXD_06005 [Nitrospira sp. T9]|uniref:hypothetical protein n=1 Tax=unclassified Nitrospira TaxID=2652172 RepID=UPI003F9DB931
MGDIKIKEAKNLDKLRISELSNVDPLVISEVRHIAPAAVHIKELNHIDPLTIESLRINEVRNLDPIRVEQFNVTNLPTVNLSLRQLPAVDMNIRRLPPVSIGLHQDFCLPSSYTLRARLLGIEFLRLNLEGRTMVSPRDKVRREQSRIPGQSFPQVVAAGNPGIPSRSVTKGSRVVVTGSPCQPMPLSHQSKPGTSARRPISREGFRPGGEYGGGRQASSGGLKVGNIPSRTFPMTKAGSQMDSMDSAVSSGED